ncbi:MAG: hypothetical protein ACYS0I_16600 [Planctomycetota bacterium]
MGEQPRQLLEFDTHAAGGGLPGVGPGLPRELWPIRVVRSRGLVGFGTVAYPGLLIS